MNDKKINNAVKKILKIKMNREEKTLLISRIMKKDMSRSIFLSPYLSSFSMWVRQYGWITTLSILLVFTVAGRGLAHTAYGALPGDPLYLTKVNIIEPLNGSLISNVQDKAQYQIDLVLNRLTEAEEMASKGALGTAVGQQLVSLLGKHTDALNSDLNDSEGDNAIRINYKNKLNAHIKLLSAISTSTESGAMANDIAGIVIKKSDSMSVAGSVKQASSTRPN